ncbi:MAG: hypothetical protein IKP40_08715 [Clostridia bacterium]|nr:hypothetical protein [Clostridia bacterium]
MYTDADYTSISAQEKRHVLLLLIPCALFLGLTGWAVAVRNETLTAAASILLGATLIAGWDLFVKPLHSYRKFVDAMLNGKRHTIQGAFLRFDEDISVVDNIRFHALHVTCVDDAGKPYERLFYFDAEKPLPEFREGQMLEICFHDKQVVSVKPYEGETV